MTIQGVYHGWKGYGDQINVAFHDKARDNINDYQQPDKGQAQMPVQTTAATAGHFLPLLQNAGQPRVPMAHLFIIR
jgi:hypothetical protein